MHRSNRLIKFLKTTAVGGLFFLLPLIVIGALVGQVVPIVMAVAGVLRDFLPVKTPLGIASLVLLAIVVLLLLCFAAGMLARRSLGKRISENFEKNLLLLFPRYAIFKDQLAGRLGGDETRPQLIPVQARFDDFVRIGFELERNERLVAVYLPGTPDPWSGSVVLLAADRVAPLPADFAMTVATFEKLGRDSLALLASQASESA